MRHECNNPLNPKRREVSAQRERRKNSSQGRGTAIKARAIETAIEVAIETALEAVIDVAIDKRSTSDRGRRNER